MISLAEASGGFPALIRMYKRLVNELISQLPLHPDILSLPPTEDAERHGMDSDTTYLVKGGMLGMRCHERRLFTWDEGDLILPDACADDIGYYAEGAVLLAGYPTVELVKAVLSRPELARLWTRILTTHQALLIRLLASQMPEDNHATPGFDYFEAGATIIRQGETADYVFSLFEGEADVLVDDVVVGHVGEGEVLGAIAVLTQSPRNATVRARSRCSVVKVPKHQFKNLIRSNPGMIHGLLTDMARQITQLNSQVVQLSA
ncbi:cyclic nucleotide-binding protein [Alcanivorax hongdengensis A-11-3]|uniref:Cyclic nucleotide-binding protein n=1 Tax=Alcanivorax hongdengensis A-11-3 TaxID=1177179 RepID=L0WEC0_9GAMM|nr:cyclic nucleotide-binding domain-containing protein [Alcanivorax hongdengensis]EKF74155.1 cyclic nucleotide-binding protein [Alcanivorax hongdengensis A-11-3]